MRRNYFILYLLIIFIVLFISFLIFPQTRNYDIEYITTQDGLSNGCVPKIIQDSQGFMWFATEGGLYRYDGYNIKLYDCGENNIRTIYEDPADSGKILWIGTGGGLFKFDQGSEKFIKFQYNTENINVIENNTIQSIYKDRAGFYWIGTGSAGLYMFDPKIGKLIRYFHDPNDSESLTLGGIFAICEDYLGYLWIGTLIGGLDRFDRETKRFTHYKYDPENPHTLESNNIYSLFEDSNRTLWIGTSGLLCRYDRKNDKFYRQSFYKSDKRIYVTNSVLSITEDNQKTLWFTCNKGIYAVSKDRQIIKFYSDNSNVSTSSICIDRSGNIWVGTYCSGIHKIRLHNKLFSHYKNTTENTINSKLTWTFSFFEDEKNNLWVGTEEGLKKFENGKLMSHPVKIYNSATQEVYEPEIIHICKSSSGKLWLAGGGYSGAGYLFELDPQTRNYITYKGKYPIYTTSIINLVVKLFKDSSDIVNIRRVTNNQNIVKNFTVDRDSYVLIYSTGEGNLKGLFDYGWITIEGNENPIWKMEPSISKYIEGPERPSSVWGQFKDREQIAFMKLKPGKYQLHYRTNDKHSYNNWVKNSPPNPELCGISVFPINETVYKKFKIELEKNDYHYIHSFDFQGGDIIEDNEGTLWCVLGYPSDIHIFNKELKQFIPVSIPTITVGDYPFHTKIIKDSSGSLWFTSYNNIIIRRDLNGNLENKFNLNDFSESNKIKLKQGALNQLYADSKGNLWIGSDIGLFKYNLTSERVTQYKFEELCFPNLIHGIVEDNNGKLWISTDNNIFKFNSETKSLRKYSINDGLPNIKYASSSCIKLKDGRIAFGGSIGFVIFHPDSINENEIPPNISITGFQIFNKQIQVGQDYPLKKAINQSEKIVLKYEQDVFTFEFAALDFTNPESNKYAYKMEGVDPEWVYTDASRRYATYTKLDPGEYKFRVKGSNNDGIWNEVGTSIIIIINPPWWRTTLAYFIQALIIISIIYLTWRLQVKRIRIKHEYEMSKFEAEKMHEVEKMKSRFFTNISHEFRTPLTLIFGPAKDISEKTKDTNIKRNAGIISRNASRLFALVNQLLDLSKLEEGKMKLEVSEQNIIPLLKELILSFASLAERKRITFNFNTIEEDLNVYIDEDKVEKVIDNLLSNAFKFTPEGGIIELRVSKSEGYVNVCVSDSGIGIPKEKISKIFDRFYQVNGTHKREYEGTGIGLALSKELIELHKGKIAIESVEGKGTTIMVSIPLGKKHLKLEEIRKSVKAKETVSDSVSGSIYFEETEKGKINTNIIIETNKPVLLLVEDNTDVRCYIRENLEKEYTVLEAFNGGEGLKISIEHIPDLIISDIKMPKMDGFELCEKLKTDERTSHIPVILLTAKATSKDKITGYETGADDYIMKPFEVKILRVRVRNLIEQRKKLREHFLQEGVFNLDNKNITSVDRKFLERAVKIINEHLSDISFGVESFASELSISRTTLYKKLIAVVGEPPGDFIKRIRLSKANNLLKINAGNISEIALEVGFDNPAYFSECFKKQFGIIPSKYQSTFTKH